MKEKDEGTISELKAMVSVLENMISNIEPILSKSFEEKFRLQGYHQALDQVSKLISARKTHLQRQVTELEEGETEDTAQEEVIQDTTQEEVVQDENQEESVQEVVPQESEPAQRAIYDYVIKI